MIEVHGYRVHPAAAAFPLMDGAEFDALVESVRKSGLNEPIVYVGDEDNRVIVDGRNRLRACVAAKVRPKFTSYEGGDLTQYVIDANINRRHLDTSQRAMIAATLATLGNGRPSKTTGSIEHVSLSLESAARKLKVGKESVKRAKVVRAKGTKRLIDATTNGDVKVSAATKIAKLPRDKQNAELAKQTKGRPRKRKAAQSVDEPINWDDVVFEKTVMVRRLIESLCLQMPVDRQLEFVAGLESILVMFHGNLESAGKI